MLDSNPDKVAKQILPAKFEGAAGNYWWRKRHGHAGSRMIERALDKAQLLGFKHGAWKGYGSPDGSVVGNRSVYHHPDGWEMITEHVYGVTAYENSFSIQLNRLRVP